MAYAVQDRVDRFQTFCRKERITLEDIQETSWGNACRYLIRYLKYGAGELHHSALIGMFKAWEESG